MKILTKILCLVFALVLALGAVSCKEDKPPKDIYTPNQAYPVTAGREGEEGKYSVTPGLFVYYMYSAAASFTEEELTEHNFDAESELSLKQQMYDDVYTWYDRLVILAEERINYLLTYCNAAVANGVDLLLGDYTRIDQSLTNQRIEAAMYGYELDDYLAKRYGHSYITEEVLKYSIQLETLANRYAEQLEEKFKSEMTDAQIDAKVKQTEGEIDTRFTRYLGQLYFAASAYGSITDAASTANRVLNTLQANPTKEKMDELAEEFGNKDILVYYENVAEGDMVAQIDEWLYASGRRVGDCGTVTYGEDAVLLLLYISDDDPVYIANAKLALINDAFDKWYGENLGKFRTGVTEQMIAELDIDI